MTKSGAQNNQYREARLQRTSMDYFDHVRPYNISLPIFSGHFNGYEIFDWIEKMDILFECHDYSERRKILLASWSFKGYANFWWEKFTRKRRVDDKGEILTWELIKYQMKKEFAPRHYEQKYGSRQFSGSPNTLEPPPFLAHARNEFVEKFFDEGKVKLEKIQQGLDRLTETLKEFNQAKVEKEKTHVDSCEPILDSWVELSEKVFVEPTPTNTSLDPLGDLNCLDEYAYMEGPALAKDEKETLYEKKDVLLEEEIIYPHESPLLEIDGQKDEEEKITIAVRELDQNSNFDWNQIQESGQEVEPIPGPGYSGLVNLGNNFKFGIEDRITCTSGKVVYNRRLDYILSFNIPLHEATNKEELAAFQKLKQKNISEGKKLENNEIESDKLSMGCNHLHCQKAAINTSNVGVQEAMNWLLSHMDDSYIDARITQEAYGVVDQSNLGVLLHFGFQEDVGLEEVFKKGHLHGEIVSLKASMGKEIVLPSLVHLFHSTDERLLSSASNALVGMLKLHNQKVEVIYAAALLLNRAFAKSAFEGVSELAVEFVDVDRRLFNHLTFGWEVD